MTNYSIDDEHSNQITTGLSEHNARQAAQRLANDRGKSVWLYRDSEDAQAFESEEIAPKNAYPNRIVCVYCERDQLVNKDGTVRRHPSAGRGSKACQGSGRDQSGFPVGPIRR